MLVISLTADAVGDAIQPIRSVALEIVQTTKATNTSPGIRFVRKTDIVLSSSSTFSLVRQYFTSLTIIAATKQSPPIRTVLMPGQLAPSWFRFRKRLLSDTAQLIHFAAVCA